MRAKPRVRNVQQRDDRAPRRCRGRGAGRAAKPAPDTRPRQVFTQKFNRKVERLSKSRGEADARSRLAELDREIGNPAAHFLVGTVEPDARGHARRPRGGEGAHRPVVRQLVARRPPHAERSVFSHPTLVRRYEDRVGRLREALNDETVRTDAMTALRSLIG